MTSKARWLSAWCALVVAILLAGGKRWPVLLQTEDQRVAHYREQWVAEQVAAGRSVSALDALLGAASSIGRAKDDIRYIRVVVSVGIVALVVLGLAQRRSRRVLPAGP